MSKFEWFIVGYLLSTALGNIRAKLIRVSHRMEQEMEATP